MNPDLVAAARAIVAARQQYPDLSPDELEQIAKSYGQTAATVSQYIEKLRSDHGNLVASTLQGFTGNFGDELVGLLPQALGGGKAGREEMRLRAELAKGDHPLGSTVAGAAGGIASGAMAGAAMPEISLLSKILPGAGTVAGAATRGALGGAAFGGISGAGEGETPADRLRRAARGTITGAAVGGVLGGAAGKAAQLVSPEAKAARRIANAVEESGGVDALKSSNAAAAAAGRGSDILAADLSPHTQMLMRFAANNNPNTYVEAAEKLNARQPNMSDRMLNDVTDLLGETPDAGARAESLAASKRAFGASDAGYEGLRKADVKFDPSDVAPFLKEPSVQAAWRLARRAGDITKGSPLDELFDKLSAANPGVAPEKIREAMGSEAMSQVVKPLGERAITFDDMHQFKQLLDDKAASAFASRQGSLGQAYATVRDAVKKAMVEKVPGYAVVDSKYAAMTRLETTLQQGIEAFNKTGTRELASDVAQMSPEELQQFRTGLASKLVDSLRDANTNRDVAKRLMDSSISMQEKLKLVFGDESTFNQFMQRVKVEAQMAKTKGAVGGSQTHLLGADAEFDPLPHIPGVVAHGPLGLFTGLLHHTLGRVSANQTAKAADIVGGKMLTQGSTAIDRLLSELAKPDPLLSGRFTGGLSGLSGSLFH